MEPTNERINRISSKFENFSTDEKINIAKITRDKVTKIIKQIFSKVSDVQMQNTSLDQVSDSLEKIFEIDAWIYVNSEVDVSIIGTDIYFDIHINLPTGTSFTTILKILNAKYQARLYWVSILSFDLTLEFKVTIKRE